MGLKTKLPFCVSIAASALFLGIGIADAEPRKDVSDAVLQEIIESFKTKVPRFINKHGNSLFVEDEPVTRGSFISALYEYDKSQKTVKTDTPTRNDIDAIKLRLNVIEKKAFEPSLETQKPEAPAPKIDITQIINDLKPNMPFLLDGTLNNSKVFAELKSKVMSEPVTGILPQQAQAGGGVDKGGLEAVEAKVRQVDSSLADLRNKVSKTLTPSDIQAQRTEMENVTNRLKKIETSIIALQLSDTKPKPDTVSKESFNKLSERIAGLEENISNSPAQKSSQIIPESATKSDINSIANRLGALEKSQAQPSSSSESINRLAEKISILEKNVSNISSQKLSQNVPESVTKNELESLAGRLSALEKNVSNIAAQKPIQNAPESITKGEVENIAGRLGMVEKNLLLVSNKLDTQGNSADNTAKNEIADLRSRLERLETSPGSKGSAVKQLFSDTPSRKEVSEINNRLSIMEKDIYVNSQKQIEDLLRRMDKIESTELIGYKDNPKDAQITVKNLVAKQDVEELESRIAFLEKDVYVNLKNDLKDTKDKMEEILKEIRAIKIDLEKR